MRVLYGEVGVWNSLTESELKVLTWDQPPPFSDAVTWNEANFITARDVTYAGAGQDWIMFGDEGPNYEGVLAGTPGAIEARLQQMAAFKSAFPGMPILDYAMPPTGIYGAGPYINPTHLVNAAPIIAVNNNRVCLSMYLADMPGGIVDYEAVIDSSYAQVQAMAATPAETIYSLWDRYHEQGFTVPQAYQTLGLPLWEELWHWILSTGATGLWWGSSGSFLASAPHLAVVQAEAIAAGFGANVVAYTAWDLAEKLAIVRRVAAIYASPAVHSGIGTRIKIADRPTSIIMPDRAMPIRVRDRATHIEVPA